MAIGPADVWDWIARSGDRRDDAPENTVMPQIVEAVEAYWLDKWSVLIRDVAGNLPDPRPVYIDQALIMQCAALWDRRKTPNGVIAGNGDVGPFRVSKFDPDVERFLDDKSWGVA